MKLLCSLALIFASLPAWAADVYAPGISNFHQVNAKVYRGGQPTDEGFQSLAKLGVKTVIDLRRPTEHDTAAEKQAVEAAGMKYINIPMQGIVAPTDDQIAKALALLNSDAAGPVFVHCKEGKDRTGTIVACYRISHDNWDNQRALKEAKSHGMHWVEIGMKSYITGYRPAMQEAAAATSAAN